jgi:hypothetical protein
MKTKVLFAAVALVFASGTAYAAVAMADCCGANCTCCHHDPAPAPAPTPAPTPQH